MKNSYHKSTFTSLIVIFGTVTSKLFGFSRDLVFSYFYGVGIISDIFNISQLIPNIIFGLFFSGLVTGLVPIMVKNNHENEKNNQILLSKILVFGLFVGLLIQIIVFTLTIIVFPQSIQNQFQWYSDYALLFFNISGLSFTLLVFNALSTALLQSKNRFFAVSLISIPFNLLWIVFIFLSSIFNVNFLVYGSLIALFGQAVYSFILLRRVNFKFLFFLRGFLKESLFFFKSLFIIILTISIPSITLLFDSVFSSLFGVGYLSIYNYTNRAILLFQGVFIIPLVSIFYTEFSTAYIKNQDSVIDVYRKNLSIFLLLIIPITALILFNSLSIITIIYGRGEMTTYDLSLIANLFFLLSFSFVIVGLKEYLLRVVFVKNVKSVLFYNFLIYLILYPILLFGLQQWFGFNSLPLTFFIINLLSILLLIYSDRKNFNIIKGIIMNFVLFAILTTGGFFIIERFLFISTNVFLSLLVKSSISLVFYGLLYLLLIKVGLLKFKIYSQRTELEISLKK
jgi:putative peptidoglycan lipid II flippase